MGCGFATVAVTLSVDGDVKTTCAARIALPAVADDNPWARRGDQWRPSPCVMTVPFSLPRRSQRWI